MSCVLRLFRFVVVVVDDVVVAVKKLISFGGDDDDDEADGRRTVLALQSTPHGRRQLQAPSRVVPRRAPMPNNQIDIWPSASLCAISVASDRSVGTSDKLTSLRRSTSPSVLQRECRPFIIACRTMNNLFLYQNCCLSQRKTNIILHIVTNWTYLICLV